jgi:divalent metal cation (Fe/Co/Zn/Cd) transporter
MPLVRNELSDARPASSPAVPNLLTTQPRCDHGLAEDRCCTGIDERSRRIVRLQIATVAWMVVECGVALASAWQARSAALLAFGSDSLIELLSAVVVLLQFGPSRKLSSQRAARLAGILLFLLAAIVSASSVTALAIGVAAETSLARIAVTIAALAIMPVLGWAKRKAAFETSNRALAADAVQSATCAWLALVTLAGLAINAVWHVGWIDSVAALAAVPIIVVEAVRAFRGQPCECC